MIREVQYPTWLSNSVMVKKDKGAWRMCVDFTDLNKVCPKDCYPLPRIDALVDSAMGYEILCFLDAFKGEGSGAGLLLEDPQGEMCSYALRFDFAASNNETEYEAVIVGLQLTCKLGARHVLVNSDSQLIVCQILGEYETREEVMRRYLSKVHQLAAHFESFEIQKISRSQNRRANTLSRLASTSFSDLNKTVLVEVLTEPSYAENVVYPVLLGNTWMGPLIRFLGHGELPKDRTEARKLQRKASRYALWQNLLYKRAPGSFAYAVVAIDYFTKWVETEPLRSITDLAVQKFFWKSVVCRFDLPRVIISDNSRQFADHPFKRWCENLGITQHFTSVGHPQANGQTENFNRTLLHGLKTRLHQAGTSWVDELPSVLWSYRTTPRSATQETPFYLTYGSEAVVPTEFITPNPRMAAFAAQLNEEERRVDLNFAEEKRDVAATKVALYKNILTSYYNARGKHLQFNSGDLVLRKNSVSRTESQGKLTPK
ncbi:uncharacterized protein [Coffea arabica]|uniref:Integrase catalytic domain-containing protein n=1 Tax=Coffea arabica TaxID=13443 RepID=A0ABM4UG05_COFAR